MKKLFALMILTVFLIAGCGGTNNTNAAKDSKTPQKTENKATDKNTKAADKTASSENSSSTKSDSKSTDTKQTATTGMSDTDAAKAAAEKILQLTKDQNWNDLYNYLHPDVQAKYSRDVFIKDRKDNSGLSAYIKDTKIESVKIINEWKDSKATGNTYKNVAEIDYIVNMNTDDSSMNQSAAMMHLVKASDGSWRNFWVPNAK